MSNSTYIVMQTKKDTGTCFPKNKQHEKKCKDFVKKKTCKQQQNKKVTTHIPCDAFDVNAECH